MTSYATNITPYAAPPRDRTGPVAALVGGSIGAFFALLLIAAGAALLWAAHYKTDDGYYTTKSHSYSTPTRALTTESLDVNGVPSWLNASDHLGRVRIDPTSTADGKPAFIGIARTRDVDAYLDGVAHDEITDFDFDPFVTDTARRTGEGRPAMPGAQTFWAASSVDGSTLDWKVRGGDWTVVVMNADGSPGVDVEAKAGAKLPIIGDLAWWFTIPGVVLGGLSLVLVVAGASGLARTRQAV